MIEGKYIELSDETHLWAHVVPVKGYAHMRNVVVVPLTSMDIEAMLARSTDKELPVPVVFSGRTRQPLAICGVPGGRNVFIDAQGNWTRGRPPHWFDVHPFIACGTEDRPRIAFDPMAPHVVADPHAPGAKPLFTRWGGPTRLNLSLRKRTRAYRKALEEAAQAGSNLYYDTMLDRVSMRLPGSGLGYSDVCIAQQRVMAHFREHGARDCSKGSLMDKLLECHMRSLAGLERDWAAPAHADALPEREPHVERMLTDTW